MKKIFLLFIFCLLFSCIKINADGVDYAQNAKSAILIEASTGEILFEKNSNEKLTPASMTKIMTLLLTMETLERKEITLDDEVLISNNASGMGGTQIFIEANTKVKVIDLLKGIGIASANDAAVAMAEYIGGTEENFVNMMNKRAQELGAYNTNFKNSHGLDEANHYTTSYDLSLIAKELVKHEKVLEITRTYEEYINVSGKNHWLVNTNSLVRFYEGMDGLKTGFTDNALYCLTATMKRNDMRLIAVVMGSETKEKRSIDVIKMMEYGYSMYSIKNIITSTKSLGKVFVDKSIDKNIKYYLKEPVNIVVDKNTKEINYKVEKEIYKVKAPLKKGSTIGKLILNYNDKEINYDLIVKETVEKAGYFRTIINNLKDITSGKINMIR